MQGFFEKKKILKNPINFAVYTKKIQNTSLEKFLVKPLLGRIQKFFEGGVLKFFCMDGKI